jgi:hypothetical protein
MANTKKKTQAGRKRNRRRLSEQRTEEARRTKTVGVRLSVEEWDNLAAQAKSCHLTKAAILRNNWLGVEPTTKPMPEVMAPAAKPARLLNVAELASYHSLVATTIKLNKLTELLQPNSELLTEVNAMFGEMRYFLAELVPPRTEKKIVLKEGNGS